MGIFVRKVSKRTWLTDTTKPLEERIRAGAAQFRDTRTGKPSIFDASSEHAIRLGVAAVAWEAAKRISQDIHRRYDYVLLTSDHIRIAGLREVRTRPSVSWRALRRRHFELTMNGAALEEAHLEGLVRAVIANPAGDGRISGDELKAIVAQQVNAGAGLLGRFLRLLGWGR